MNHETIQKVQQSFAQVTPIAPIAAGLFYDNLFRLDPNLRPLFRGDMKAQGEKLMHMIGVAVARLSHPESLAPVLENLGRNHAGYGVKDEHYAVVGSALIATLHAGLGAAFTSEVRAAWIEVYSFIASTMQRGAATKVQAA